MNALIGKKVGMTRVFTEDGSQVPVTVIEAGPCRVVQQKTRDREGYDAVQIGFEETRESRVTRPLAGHFKKAGLKPHRFLAEVAPDEGDELDAGTEVGVSIFEGCKYVDVSGTSKGRGFEGVMKRFNFGGGRATHGSHSKRRPGAVGQCEMPGRLFKNRKMPGRMGGDKVTVQNLEVVEVRPEENVLLVRGAVPGHGGGIVAVRKAIKRV